MMSHNLAYFIFRVSALCSFQSLQAVSIHRTAAMPAMMRRYAFHCAYYSIPIVDTAYTYTARRRRSVRARQVDAIYVVLPLALAQVLKSLSKTKQVYYSHGLQAFSMHRNRPPHAAAASGACSDTVR
jgi:hypothetical protein